MCSSLAVRRWRSIAKLTALAALLAAATPLLPRCLSAQTAQPKPGQTAPAPAPKSAQPGSATQSAKSATPARKPLVPKLDLNSATAGELKTLPGIDDPTALKIINNRPYRMKTDLVRKKILSQTEYAKISDQVIARQAATTKAKSRSAEAK